MGALLGWGAVIAASIAAPYVLPAPQSQKDKTTDTLFRLSLITGIIVSGFAIYGYLKKR